MRAEALIALALGLATLLKGCHGSNVESTQCAYLDDNPPSASNSNPNQLNPGNADDSLPAPIINTNNNTRICSNPSYHCFGLWTFESDDPNNKTLIKQGCWEDDSDRDCNDQVCWRRRSPKKTYFCCCRGNMCNLNVQDAPWLTPALISSTLVPTVDGIQQDPAYKHKTIIIAIMSVLVISVITIVSYLVYRLWFGHTREPLEPTVSLLEAPPTPSFESDQLKILELIERGRYGEVWRGTLNDSDVAVKIFGPHQKQYYFNEKDLYSLPHMDHPSLPQYYGCDQRLTAEGMMQYMLVMSYIPGGTLMAYLKEHTLDWMTLCKMIHSVASGMAHLHSDVAIKGGKEKPAIAHRDFNTRNILVKADLTCCVCDFGFAMKIMGSKFFRNGQEENAESSSLTDVGTMRYMAPEVLEGAVNLRDCEASLKQIDVYSLGLVIWEISSRCADLYQGMPVPEYMLPFQAEVGAHPTFEDMQLLVSRNKQRPVFPDVWKDSNPAIRALKDTIEECWDPDAEARLTSLCVEERALEMTALWEARHKGVTPTLNPTGHLGNIADQSIIQRNLTSSQATDASSRDLPDRNGNVALSGPGMDSDDLTEPPGGNSTNRMSRYTDNSVSTSTTETTLTASPTTGTVSEIAPVAMVTSNKANRNLAFARSNRILQPHQGQNPTVERNTHKGSDEEIAIEGNTLIDKSRPQELTDHDGFSSATLSDDLFDTIAENLESSLVQNDMLNRHHGNFSSNRNDHPQPVTNPRPPPPPMIVRPKQPNVPGNGSAHHLMRPNEPKQKNPKFKLKKPKKKKVPTATLR